MDQQQIRAIFENCGAFLQGHFLLSSGLHSNGYLQCALVCQDPHTCARLCEYLARPFRGTKIDAVIGPAIGGIVLAYEMARAVGARGIFMERDDTGRMTLRRGFSLNPGERILVAEDVMTTGGSAAEIVEAVEKAGAQVEGLIALVNRGGAKRFEGRRVVTALEVKLPTWPADQCPLCKQGMPIVKPGSRKRPGA